MKKKRIILIVVILLVLGMFAGGIYWLIRRSTGVRLLARADLALRAGKLEKAVELSEKYIGQKPNDWRGYHFLGQAKLRLGQYDEARKPLKEAADRAPDDVITPLLAMAHTYSWPAAQTLAAARSQTDPEKVIEAIDQYAQANKVLRGIKVFDQKVALDVTERVGLNHQTVSRAWRHLSSGPAAEASTAKNKALLAEKDGRKAEASRLEIQASEKRLESAGHLAAAKEAAEAGIEVLLGVIQKDPTRREAARGLVEMCIERCNDALSAEHRDDDSRKEARKAEADLAQASKLIMNAEPRPPIAAMKLAHYELRTRSKTESASQRRQRLDKFRILLDELLEADPKVTEVKLVRAEIALMLDDRKTARRISKEVLKADPGDHRARLIKAQLMMRDGNNSGAVELLMSITTEFRGWAEAHYIYAQAAQAAGKAGLASQEMRLVTELDRNHVGARRFLAATLLGDKHYARALYDAREYYRAHPNDPDAVRLLAEAAFRTKQPELAKKTLLNAEKVDEKTKRGPSTRMMLAISDAYRALGQKDQAARTLNLAADTPPETSGDHLASARALLRIGRASEAEKILLQEIDRNGDQAELCFELGGVYQRSRRALQAIEQFRIAVKLNGQDRRYRLALARMLLASGDVESAAIAIETISASDPDAKLLRLQIDLARGKDPATAVPKQLMGDKRAGGALALTYYRTGKLEKCVETCLAELEKKPDAHELRLLLGEAYFAMDRKDESIKEWSTVLKAKPDHELVYRRIATAMSAKRKPPAVESLLGNLPGAQPEMIDLTMGWLYGQVKDFKSAVAAYDRLLARKEVSELHQLRAGTLRAISLASSDKVDDAVAALDAMAKKSEWAIQAGQTKVNILVRAGRRAPAIEALEQVRKIVVDKKNGLGLLQIAGAYLRLGAVDEALAICEQAKGVMEKDAQPFILQAKILAATGKRQESLAPLHQAISLQPGNLDARVALARAHDSLHLPRKALDTLRRLEKTGQAGLIKALYEQGRLFATWGLSAQSVDVMKQLGQVADESIPDIQLTLGRALAGLGQYGPAAVQLKNVSAYSAQYMQAQQVLAGITTGTDAKIKILDQLAKAKPGLPEIIAQKMNVLLSAGRQKEALDAFKTFMEGKIADRSKLEALYLAGYRAMLEGNDLKSAAAFASDVAGQTRAPRWRQLAVIVAIDANPTIAATLMANTTRPGINDAYLGIAMAVQRGDSLGADTWANQAQRIAGQMAAAKPPRSVPARYRLLAAIAVQQAQQANDALVGFGVAGAMARAAAMELVRNAAGDSGAPAEAARLLQATIAIDFGLKELGRQWAEKLLSRRPRCQWAAVLAYRTGLTPEASRKLVETLNPKGSTTARFIEASLLDREGKFDQAAEIYRALAEEHKGDVGILLGQATAVEKTGNSEKALELYRKILKDSPNLVAANNGAYLVSQIYPTDMKRLTEALGWMNNTVKAQPRVAAFRETRGWLAWLAGDKPQARADIREAIKGLRNSTDGHYHLGIIEGDAGDKEMARWHLQAAVNSIAAIEASGRKATVSERKVAELAKEALAKISKDAGT